MWYCSDDAAPLTRSIAVGVGEMGVLDEYELMAAGRSDSSTHITNMALQQLNMAAFQSRQLRFSNEQLRDVLDAMLKKVDAIPYETDTRTYYRLSVRHSVLVVVGTQ